MASPDSAPAQLKDWDGKKVPPGVYHALATPYRGQSGLGKKMTELLSFFFDDAAVLVVPTQLSITYYGGERRFTTLTVDVFGAACHACSVERINKSHGYVHSKARASLSNGTTRKSLYAFTNESLLYKVDQKGGSHISQTAFAQLTGGWR